MIPARWRPKDPHVIFTALLWPIKEEEFLLVLPPARWQTMLETLRTKALSDERVATFERVVGATSAQLLLDKAGRFCLPDHLAVPAGLEQHAQFVGRLEKFEIWSPQRYHAATPDEKTVAAAVAKEFNL